MNQTERRTTTTSQQKSIFLLCRASTTSPDRRTILRTFNVSALSSYDLRLRHAITAQPRCSKSGCTPSYIISSPTEVWSPSPLLSLTLAGEAAKTVLRDVQCPRFSFVIMRSFGATFLMTECPSWRQPHAWDAVSYSPKSYIICQNSLIQLHNVCAQLLNNTPKMNLTSATK